jgi:hypothetical protein
MAVIGSVANVGVLPVPMLTISNWGLATPNYRMECCQTAERVHAKLPNGFAPNYRMDSRQTTERLLRGIGYFDITFAI